MIIGSSTTVFSQLNIELMRKDDDVNGVFNTVSLYSDFETGNTEYLEIASSYRIDWNHEDFYTFINSYLKYKESDFDVKSNRGYIHWRFVLEVDNFIQPEIFVQKEFDKFLDITDRNVIGGGARFKLFQTKKDTTSKSKFTLNAGIGLMWEKESFIEEIPNTKIFRSTNYVSFRWIINSYLKIIAGLYFQADIKRIKDNRVYFDSDIIIKLTDFLSLTSNIHYRYDNEPPWTIKYYDFEIVSGISLNF